MNLDDESFLSAYLDDELDPPDRLAVEWAVEASPPMAEELLALRATRDAVARLPRPPAPVDLGAMVQGRIKRARRRSRSIAAPARWVAAAAGISAMVASLLFAVVLVYRTTHELDQPLIVLDPEPGQATRTHPIVTAPASSPTVVVNEPIPVVGPPAPVPKLKTNRRSTQTASTREAREREDRKRIAGMLNGRKVLTAAIVTDVFDASEQVRTMLVGDARRNPEFGRITIYQGIVVDPDHPDEADVFPVVIDEPGSGPFLDRLREKFPGLVVKADTNPDILTQLPEVGHVAFFPGTEAAPLGDPPSELGPRITATRVAPRIEDKADYRLVTTDEDEDAVPPVARTHPQEPRPPSAVAKSDKPVQPEPLTIAGDTVTILIWVPRPTRH